MATDLSDDEISSLRLDGVRLVVVLVVEVHLHVVNLSKKSNEQTGQKSETSKHSSIEGVYWIPRTLRCSCPHGCGTCPCLDTDWILTLCTLPPGTDQG